MAPRFVPDARPIALDPRGISGAAAAIVVAMINKTEGFSISNPDHVEHLSNAIEIIVPQFCETMERQCQSPSNGYTE